ncbi:MAG TPA: DMT family transporter [Chitinophagaceae bacterium]|nr:DMT family transporter [Chitinophagaceae bacterium]
MTETKHSLAGIALAVLATIIWAGNFLIARGVYQDIPPISLAFYRWLIAAVILLPFAINAFKKEWPVIKRSSGYLFWVALTGVTLFNTFVYIGGHYSTATNLALIGTTTSPVISVILARVFLKENIGWLRIAGMSLCITGIIYLISGGSWSRLMNFHFTKGDGWILLAALTFAIYNNLVRKKPAAITPVNFLFVIFSLGTILLFPFYLWELSRTPAVQWNWGLIGACLYLGLGASVICFLIWNKAIHDLGAGRTALFGNLIPVFSSLGAVIFLNEQFTWVHAISMLFVFAGVLLFNLRMKR